MSTRIARTYKTMRKEPQQARSRATVDAIVQAGTQVLGRRGWAGFTTNEVAAVAGVSIGSLYQYFPDKLALTEAIRLQHVGEVLGVVRDLHVDADADAQPLEEHMRALIDGLLAVHGPNPSLHRALLEEAPRGQGAQSAHAAFERQYLRHYEALVLRHRKGLGPKGAEMAALVLCAAIEGVVHHAALKGWLDSPKLKRELVSLVCAYLRAQEPAHDL